ncbi:NADH-quinone oxidoreductase subunit L [Aquimonas voraii]|uniref:NADH dehydrogenase subunit L n=1 Tax=Aquimonas voraii TaxID=265719 RepID=A0A1G6UF83_9GAMM|nr:NADH-quinone oxidoreductase subunit L [Aquimonas voraii]SDD40048.1 NADH dehydrogenase subunit L [Aquimonas voraii]
MISENVLLLIALAPLLGAIVAGLFGKQIGRAGAHWVTILGVAVSCALSVQVLYQLVWGGAPVFNQNIYTWFEIGEYSAHVGFLVDRLTAMMMVVVTFVSLLVHIYTIGYMEEDPGYQRFFAYISLFTFSMLMLVMSNNFLQLFFGWEAVGLVSYLLIGFWFKKPSAVFANMKAFLVNRVGDFGFLLGIAGVLYWLGTLDYQTAFDNAPQLAGLTVEIWPGAQWAVPTFICICLFIGAMGKSAQVPLHVWLPDSMEGPTPISALIHAATMVTAGIFMVARMSPLFEMSETALAFVLFIGATTALFTGLIGVVQNDIKRVVAYSTLSQLGYMTVALGVSAYAGAVFHLMTHAFFKALLFLAAGSVIIGMHHEQDMRRMGGLRKYMPITWITSLIGTLALVGTPFLSGYYSKDTIIEAAGVAAGQGGWVQNYAYLAVLLGVFITSFYSFRLLYLTFHGPERFRDAHAHDDHHHDAHHDDHGHGHGPHEPHESPWVVTLPLILLAIPSIAIGFLTVGPMVFGDYFAGAITVLPEHDSLAGVAAKLWHDAHGWVSAAVGFGLHFYASPAFWLAFGGFAAATYLYLFNPDLAARMRKSFALPVRVLENKYGFDDFNQAVFAGGSLKLGRLFWKAGDTAVIDGVAVNGSAALVDRISAVVRNVQSGLMYHYAFAMILGLIALLGALIWSLRV